jgi:septum formation topological specificity factor MinE
MRVEGSQWFTVNYSYASKVLKDIYKNYKNYTLKAKKLTLVNKSKFTLDAMTKELEKIIDKYIPEFPEEVKLKLPKLKKVGDKTELPKIKLPKLKKV